MTKRKDPSELKARSEYAKATPKYDGTPCPCDLPAVTSSDGVPMCRRCYDRARWRKNSKASRAVKAELAAGPDLEPEDRDWVAEGTVGRWFPTGRGVMVWRTCSREQLQDAG